MAYFLDHYNDERYIKIADVRKNINIIVYLYIFDTSHGLPAADSHTNYFGI